MVAHASCADGLVSTCWPLTRNVVKR